MANGVYSAAYPLHDVSDLGALFVSGSPNPWGHAPLPGSSHYPVASCSDCPINVSLSPAFLVPSVGWPGSHAPQNSSKKMGWGEGYCLNRNPRPADPSDPPDICPVPAAFVCPMGLDLRGARGGELGGQFLPPAAPKSLRSPLTNIAGPPCRTEGCLRSVSMETAPSSAGCWEWTMGAEHLVELFRSALFAKPRGRGG